MGVMSYVDLRTEIERPSPIMCSVAARRFAWPVQIARAVVGMRVHSIPAKQARPEPVWGCGRQWGRSPECNQILFQNDSYVHM